LSCESLLKIKIRLSPPSLNKKTKDPNIAKMANLSNYEGELSKGMVRFSKKVESLMNKIDFDLTSFRLGKSGKTESNQLVYDV